MYFGPSGADGVDAAAQAGRRNLEKPGSQHSSGMALQSFYPPEPFLIEKLLPAKQDAVTLRNTGGRTRPDTFSPLVPCTVLIELFLSGSDPFSL